MPRTTLPHQALLSFVSLTALGAAFATGGCSADDVGSDSANAMEKHAKIVDSIPPEALVEGVFDPNIRVYGYIVEAKAGAKINIDLLKAIAGSEMDQRVGAPLDTVMRVNGPYESSKDPGPLLAESEDGPDGRLSAPPIHLQVKQDGRYLVSFSSWENTGTGEYQLKLSCDGTDFQCRRPEHDKPCNSSAGTLFIQGKTIVGDPVWDHCEVVLLEQATLRAGHTLTVKPGVTVKGNYLGSGGYGNVSLIVMGTLQAAGTAEHPVVFTSFSEDRGWRGLELNGTSHTLSHVVIERASQPVLLGGSASATIEDTLLEGTILASTRSIAGIRALGNNDVTLTRSVVTNYNIGLHLRNADRFVVLDSVIVGNQIGVQVDGQNPTNRCQPPPPPPARYYDPVFEHTDIMGNETQGIFINGSDILVQVSKSNLINNGQEALLVGGRALHAESFLRDNNILDNSGDQPDVRTYHRQGGGTLDISYNYWRDISDPALSAHWRSDCAGPISFTGFSPEPIDDAGARSDLMTEELSKYAHRAQTSGGSEGD